MTTEDPTFSGAIDIPQGDLPYPSSPWNTVVSRFDTSLAMATDMLEKLIGVEGVDTGYLGALNDILETYSMPTMDPLSITIPDLTVDSDTRPAVAPGAIDTDFPTFTTQEPVTANIPTIDISEIQPAVLPDEVNATLTWSEIPYNSDIYTDLLNRILTDIQSGATGLDPTVEQEIWDRAIARQQVENDKALQETETYFSSRGFEIPPGAMVAKIQEVNNEINRNNTELNSKIAISQAELAQKNSQFIIQQAMALESILREFHAKVSGRSFDKAKTTADLILQNYSEKIKAYLSVAEANKIYVEVQVENLKGVVEYNRGLLETFKSQLEAYNLNIEAITNKNNAVIEGFKAEVLGYEAETRAITANQSAQIEKYKLELQKGDIELRKYITEVDSTLKAYGIEISTREKIAKDMADIAAQSVASALNSVNASASLGYSGSESVSESFSHSEGVSENISRNTSYSESKELEPN